MHSEDVDALLAFPESEDLDWKRTLPQNLLQGTSAEKELARATIAKDVAAMANAASMEVGHIVYGYGEVGGERVLHRPMRSRSAPLDEAKLRTWLHRMLEPEVAFEYAEFPREEGLVGLLRVHRRFPYPHVAQRTVGELSIGQVHIRVGTQNRVAGYADLRRLFSDADPMTFQHLHSPELEEFALKLQREGYRTGFPLANTEEEYERQGWTTARWPGTRRKIYAGRTTDGKYGHVLIYRRNDG